MAILNLATPDGILSPEAASRLMELAKSPYRPPEILRLKEEIDASMRAAELRASITGSIDFEKVTRIVNMKLELDRLYGLWAEEKL